MKIKCAFLAIISMVIVVIAGCNNTSVPNSINLQFSAAATLNNCVYDIIYTGKNLATVTVSEPEEIKGVTYIWQGGDCSIEYGELACKTDTLYLPDSSYAVIIVNVLNELNNMESLQVVSSSQESTVFKGNCTSGDFTVMVDNATTFVQSITMTDSDILIKLSKLSPVY
ncbi:MAG TPA: hypothetical protein GX401_04335 [Clostridiales bacterium]|nr:hypothetical protein [Clostridiales bacterium]